MLSPLVADYLAANQAAHLERLFELLRFPSISSRREHDADCLACARHLADWLIGLGFSAELRPCRRHPLVIAHSPPGMAPAGSPTVLLYGHYDVQPADPLDQWRSPPFEPSVRDGNIYARGASDDKGQFITHILAVEAAGGLPKVGATPKRPSLGDLRCAAICLGVSCCFSARQLSCYRTQKALFVHRNRPPYRPHHSRPHALLKTNTPCIEPRPGRPWDSWARCPCHAWARWPCHAVPRHHFAA